MIRRFSRLHFAALLASLLLSAQHPALAHGDQNAEQEAPKANDASVRGVYGGPFILMDHNGKTVTDDEYRGKAMLLTFGYTNCGDICPTMLQNMARVMDLLGDQAKEVQPLFITLDPSRDTPPKLRDYVAAFHPQLIGLTGPEPYVAAAARKYRIRYEKVPGANGDYSIDHTAVVFLMGKDGNFLERFPHNTAPEKIAERVRLRLAEAPPVVTP